MDEYALIILVRRVPAFSAKARATKSNALTARQCWPRLDTGVVAINDTVITVTAT
jgi:hypothetical protein